MRPLALVLTAYCASDNHVLRYIPRSREYFRSHRPWRPTNTWSRMRRLGK
jgi:hypothetical protein